jgi:hypothetical protein
MSANQQALERPVLFKFGQRKASSCADADKLSTLTQRGRSVPPNRASEFCKCISIDK